MGGTGLLLEQNDEWAVQRARYMTLGRLYRASPNAPRPVADGLCRSVPRPAPSLSAIPREEDNTWVIAGHLPALPPTASSKCRCWEQEAEPVERQTWTPPASNPGAARRRAITIRRIFSNKPGRRHHWPCRSRMRPFEEVLRGSLVQKCRAASGFLEILAQTQSAEAIDADIR